MNQILEFDFGTFRFFDHYIIGEPQAHANMDEPTVKELLKFTQSRYQHPFFYIGNRINQNSVDPHMVDRISAQIPFLTAIAIVYYHESTKRLLELEQGIAKAVPFDYFDSIELAHLWGTQQLALKSKD